MVFIKLKFDSIYGQNGIITATTLIDDLKPGLNINNNKDETLFLSNPNAGAVFYNANIAINKANCSVTAGWLYANAKINGELNTQNQPYFLFPYQFYRINADLKAQALFAALGTKQNFGIFNLNIDLGVMHCFYDNGSIDIHYKRKNFLFGGAEDTENYPVNIQGTGAAFLVLNASWNMPVKNSILKLELQKISGIPWGFKNITLGSHSSSAGRNASSLLRTALLSGLSIHGTLFLK